MIPYLLRDDYELKLENYVNYKSKANNPETYHNQGKHRMNHMKI